MKKIAGYIVGREWYSEDNVGIQNTTTTITQIYSEYESALNKYDSEQTKDKNWEYGYDLTWITPIFSNGTVGNKYFDKRNFVSDVIDSAL